MENLIKDIRYGVRSFLKRPGFLIIAVSKLALEIGATTAMFTVVNSVLLRPLQFPEPDRIVLIEGVVPRQGMTGGRYRCLTWRIGSNRASRLNRSLDFLAWRFFTGDDEIDASRQSALQRISFHSSVPIRSTVALCRQTMHWASSEPVVVISYSSGNDDLAVVRMW